MTVLQQYLKTENEVKTQADRNERYQVVKATREQRALAYSAHDETGMALIHWAALYNQAREITRLIASGVDVNSKTNNRALVKGATAIYIVSIYGHKDAALELMKHKPDLNIKPGVERMTSFTLGTTDIESLDSAFFIALRFARAEVVAILLKPTLESYINARSKLQDYKTHYTFLGKTFNFGYSKDAKVQAANALMDFLNAPQGKLLQEIAVSHPAIQQSFLGKIFNGALLAERFIKAEPGNAPRLNASA